MIEKEIEEVNQEYDMEMEKESIEENNPQTEQSSLSISIYEKLTYIQNDLLEIPIPKNGKNPFGGFSYYELEDLLPPILKLCKKYGCTLYFNFPVIQGKAYTGELNLVNWEDKYDKIKVEVPFPQLEKLPKMNYAQVSGTYQTYMKRYLILHTFDIVEKEVIDSGFLDDGSKKSKKNVKKNGVVANTHKTTQKKNSKNNNESSNDNEKKDIESIEEPACLQKVRERCHELHSEKECNGKLLNKVSLKMFNDKEITLAERKAVFNYIKTLK